MVPHDDTSAYRGLWPYLGWKSVSKIQSSLWSAVTDMEEEGFYACFLKRAGYSTTKYFCFRRESSAARYDKVVFNFANTSRLVSVNKHLC